jgi:tRNA U34 2-thiouridine synthase MnmA/TrmU
MSTPRLKEDGRPVKAIGLLSGGLDSTLAARVIAEQGIAVLGVNFSTGFCRSDHHRAMGALGKQQDPRRLRNEALRAGADLEVPVRIVDIAADYLNVILRPRHGYGANLNPCVDCRAYMLRAARAIMVEEGADFVFTGEVLGQRPMSQHLQAMQTIERESGLTGLLLRA